MLFHAVLSGNEWAFKALLREGAAPDWKNRAGNTLLTLIAKRNLVGWADNCVKIFNNTGMDEKRRKYFVNLGSYNGKGIFGNFAFFELAVRV